jgi:hypothetical protein
MNQDALMKERQALSIEDTPAAPYGCCGLFDLCSDDDVLSLSLMGMDPFLDWLGFQASTVCKVHRSFITWAGPEGTAAGAATEGYLADPCATPNDFEYGVCDWEIEDFGRLRRGGPTREANKPLTYCENEPRWRMDGTRVSTEYEWDALFIAEALTQDIQRYTVTGNVATGGLYDGLQQLVTTGYTSTSGRVCTTMDSIVIDWNGNGMNGGAGITWNGNAVAATFNMIDVLRAAFRRIRTRLRWAKRLNRRLQVGDIVLVLPTDFTYCLLDAFTCWSVCEGGQYNEVNMNTHEARQFRNNLMGGLFGDGRIFLDSFEIPLIGYDWELINGPTTFDMYMLTGSVGGLKLLYYEYLDQRTAQSLGGKLMPIETGRFLQWTESDETCYTQRLEIKPRLISWAPWSNVRFQDVTCDLVADPISPDPLETSFFPEDSFSIADCP